LYFKDGDKLDVENYTKYILWFIGGGLFFWSTLALMTNKTVMPVLLLFLALQQFFYIGCLDIFLDQKMKYFFTFFRIFRFEHTKLTYFFLDYKIIDVSSLTQIFYN
jgi:hypothetical protein